MNIINYIIDFIQNRPAVDSIIIGILLTMMWALCMALNGIFFYLFLGNKLYKKYINFKSKRGVLKSILILGLPIIPIIIFAIIGFIKFWISLPDE